MEHNSKIAVLGAAGMVGKSIVRALKKDNYTNIIEATRETVDLTDQRGVSNWFYDNKPEYVFLAAAKVGGIVNNSKHPADFGYENGILQLNVLHNAYIHGVRKLLFLGSSCIYPKNSTYPIQEDALMSGQLEPTNEMYAMAKIYGIKLCQAYNRQYGCNFISCMPSNIYGEGDNFKPDMGHVIPSIINRMHTAKINNLKSITCYGSGNVFREFLYVDDLADACIFLMHKYDKNEPINVGCGYDIQIKDLTYKIANIIGYTGEIIWDITKPDGVYRKTVNTDKINTLGWSSSVDIEYGLRKTYEWYINHKDGINA
jgi:GDP-L-fucose synthase